MGSISPQGVGAVAHENAQLNNLHNFSKLHECKNPQNVTSFLQNEIHNGVNQ